MTKASFKASGMWPLSTDVMNRCHSILPRGTFAFIIMIVGTPSGPGYDPFGMASTASTKSI